MEINVKKKNKRIYLYERITQEKKNYKINKYFYDNLNWNMSFFQVLLYTLGEKKFK